MTPGELKFALCVEAALNRIPEPEYRQLVVEMLMVLSLVVEYHPEQTLGDTIDVDDLVWEGHDLYLKDQVRTDRIAAFIFPYYALLSLSLSLSLLSLFFWQTSESLHLLLCKSN